MLTFDIHEITGIVSGRARGADSLAEKFAHDYNLLLYVKEPDWKKYERAAGPKHNKLIVDEADVVAHFQLLLLKVH